MQHTDTEYMGQVEEELLAAVLEAIPVQKRLEGLSAEELAAGMSEEQASRLRELWERNKGGASGTDR